MTTTSLSPHEAPARKRLLINSIEQQDREMLRCYRPLPHQEEFHRSNASERIIRGGNRSGKTVCAAVEFASAVTRVRIVGADGKQLPFKYPTRPILAWVIGWDQRHIGQTIHRMLFEPGMGGDYRVVRDEETGLWRAFNQVTDADRSEEAKLAEPLIPGRMLEDDPWSWENHAEQVFSTVRLKNGTKICAFPSTSTQAKQGDAVDLIWIDEDIRWERHVGEWQARLSDRKGRMMWSAWPHSHNEALVRMSERAKEQEGDKYADVTEHRLRYSANPFIDDDEKRKRIRGWSESERRARDFGDFVFGTELMYNFAPSLHGINGDDKLGKLYKKEGKFPDHWSRYLVLDPGHQSPAVLFFVVAEPSQYGDVVILEDELCPHKLDCNELAKLVVPKVAGRGYEAFIMDKRAGRQTPMGAGKTVVTQYSDAFRKRGLTCRLTGSYFIAGSDNRPGRQMKVRDWLGVRDDNTTKFRILLDKTPTTQQQFARYRKRIVHAIGGGTEIKEEAVAGNDDTMHCLEYLAAHDPKYVPATKPKPTPSPVYLAWKRMNKGKQQRGSNYVHLGPGPTASAYPR